MSAFEASQHAEVIDDGQPVAPPTISIDLFGRQYPLMHGAASYVASAPEVGSVILAIGHPGFTAGFYMGLSANSARTTAAWLLSAADDLDGGAGKQ